MNTQTTTHSFGFRSILVGGLAFLVATQLVSTASAQSGSRQYAPSSQPTTGSSTRPAGSGTRPAGTTVEMQGFCPVCIIEMKQWVKGSAQFPAQVDGKTYLFPGEDQRQMFLKDPAKYTPALGGDCVVSLVEMGKRVPGSLHHAAYHNGRLYLFAGEQGKSMFLANPAKYENADLAYNGKCSVCRIEMNQDVQGVPEFTSLLNGMRYQFPGQEQQQMFSQNPTKYK